MRKPFPIKHALVWEAALCVFPHSGRSVMRNTVLSTFFARNRISYSQDNCLHSERWSPTSEADTHTAGGRWTYCTNTRSSPRTASPPRLGNGWTAQEMQQGSRQPVHLEAYERHLEFHTLKTWVCQHPTQNDNAKKMLLKSLCTSQSEGFTLTIVLLFHVTGCHTINHTQPQSE